MRQFVAQGIVLTRTDFGEADRILTFITPDHGKIKAMAKGVRKSKAKLAGAVELFSISDITVVNGRAEIDTLISARLARHYGNIVKNIERTDAAYEVLRIVNKITEDKADESYFNLLSKTLEALNDEKIAFELTDFWFRLQLLKITGHSPDLRMGRDGIKLSESKNYAFDFDKTRFTPSENGEFKTDQIKLLRIGLAAQGPRVLNRVRGREELLPPIQPLVQTILQQHLRV